MITLRAMNPEDIPNLRKIHASFFDKEFSFDNFLDANLLHGIVAVEDEQIIAAGGLKMLVEEVLLQNKEFSVRTRREAVYKVHLSLIHTAKEGNQLGVHAFVQDPRWMKHLKRFGYRETCGRSIVCDTF